MATDLLATMCSAGRLRIDFFFRTAFPGRSFLHLKCCVVRFGETGTARRNVSGYRRDLGGYTPCFTERPMEAGLATFGSDRQDFGLRQPELLSTFACLERHSQSPNGERGSAFKSSQHVHLFRDKLLLLLRDVAYNGAECSKPSAGEGVEKKYDAEALLERIRQKKSRSQAAERSRVEAFSRDPAMARSISTVERYECLLYEIEMLPQPISRALKICKVFQGELRCHLLPKHLATILVCIARIVARSSAFEGHEALILNNQRLIESFTQTLCTFSDIQSVTSALLALRYLDRFEEAKLLERSLLERSERNLSALTFTDLRCLLVGLGLVISGKDLGMHDGAVPRASWLDRPSAKQPEQNLNSDASTPPALWYGADQASEDGQNRCAGVPIHTVAEICKAINFRIREACTPLPPAGATPRSRDNPQRTRRRNKHVMTLPLSVRLRVGLDGREFFLIPYALAQLAVFDRELIQHCIQRLEPLALSRISAACLDIMLAIEGFSLWALHCGPGGVLEGCSILEMESAVSLPHGAERYRLNTALPRSSGSYSALHASISHGPGLLPQTSQGSGREVDFGLWLPGLNQRSADRYSNSSPVLMVPYLTPGITSANSRWNEQSQIHNKRYYKTAARIALLWQFLLEERTSSEELVILMRQALQWNVRSVLIWRVLAGCLEAAGNVSQLRSSENVGRPPFPDGRLLKMQTLARKLAGLPTRKQTYYAALEAAREHPPTSSLSCNNTPREVVDE